MPFNKDGHWMTREQFKHQQEYLRSIGQADEDVEKTKADEQPAEPEKRILAVDPWTGRKIYAEDEKATAAEQEQNTKVVAEWVSGLSGRARPTRRSPPSGKTTLRGGPLPLLNSEQSNRHLLRSCRVVR